MCKRIGIFICFAVLFFGQVDAQVPGLTRSGANRVGDTLFLDQYGGEVPYPRLSPNGQILYYPPLVVLDSMRMTSDHAAVFYGTIPFDGWSPVLSRGFDYGVRLDFSPSERVTVAGTTGSFETEISGTLHNRDYYVRPFAVNAYGTTYGAVASFRTAVGPVVLDTLLLGALTSTDAEITVKITDNGGAPLTAEVVAFFDEDDQDTAAYGTLPNTTGMIAVVPLSGLLPATDYFVRAVLTNGRFSDTLRLRFHTPSDLDLSIGASGNPTTYLCTGGTTIVYTAMLSGTDPHKPLYQFRWTSSAGPELVGDTVYNVLYETEGNYTVTVDAFYGVDTLTATFTQVISPRSGTASFYVCTEELKNTAEATTTGIASIRWLNEDRDIVATTKSVKLPTGYYTVECTDGYGCILSKEVFVGKRKLSCIISDTPGSHESARFEDGVWKIDSISDVDGYWYTVTQIGRLCWLRQNLRTRHMPSTHQDLLGTGSDVLPDMYYKGNTYVYDPETTPYYGAFYNWAAAVDVSRSESLSSTYSYFTSQRQGICPEGWHLPNKREIWEIVDTLLHLCCEGVDLMPAPGTEDLFVAQNTPIKYMVIDYCYDSFANLAYPREIYDASNLSLTDYSRTIRKFWLVDPGLANYAGCAFAVPPVNMANQGCSVSLAIRKGEFLAVRCVRNYPEE